MAEVKKTYDLNDKIEESLSNNLKLREILRRDWHKKAKSKSWDERLFVDSISTLGGIAGGVFHELGEDIGREFANDAARDVRTFMNSQSNYLASKDYSISALNQQIRIERAMLYNNKLSEKLKDSYIELDKKYGKQGLLKKGLMSIKMYQQKKKIKKLRDESLELMRDYRTIRSINENRKKIDYVLNNYENERNELLKKGKSKKLLSIFRKAVKQEVKAKGLKKGLISAISLVKKKIKQTREDKLDNEIKAIEATNNLIKNQKEKLNSLYTRFGKAKTASARRRIKQEIRATKTTIKQASKFGAKVTNRLRHSENKKSVALKKEMKNLKNQKAEIEKEIKALKASHNRLKSNPDFKNRSGVLAMPDEIKKLEGKLGSIETQIESKQKEIDNFKDKRKTHSKNDKKVNKTKKEATKIMAKSINILEKAPKNIDKKISKLQDKIDSTNSKINKEEDNKKKSVEKIKALKELISHNLQKKTRLEQAMRAETLDSPKYEKISRKIDNLISQKNNLEKQWIKEEANIEKLDKKIGKLEGSNKEYGKKLASLRVTQHKCEVAIKDYNKAKETLENAKVSEIERSVDFKIGNNKLQKLGEKFQKYTTIDKNSDGSAKYSLSAYNNSFKYKIKKDFQESKIGKVIAKARNKKRVSNKG